MNPSRRWIFGTLCFSIFITVAGVGIVVPLLPVYARTLGGSGFAIGMIFGAFSISRTALLPWFGSLSDRKGRKPFIVSGLFLYAAISLAFTLADNVAVLILIRFVQGAASAMMMPVIQAYIGDITPGGREGRAMGLFSMSTFLGLSTGPLLGGFINDHFGLTATFLCMGALSFAGFMASITMLPPVGREAPRSGALHGWGLGLLFRDPGIAMVCGFRVAYAAGIGILWGFLPVYAHETMGLASTAIGLLVTVGILASGLLQAPMGVMADRVDKCLMVMSGGVLASLALLLMYFVEGFPGTLLLSILFGIGGGVAMPAVNALGVVKGTRHKAMGVVMALMNLAHSAGILLGSLIAGAAMDLLTLRLAFPSGGAVMMLSALAFFHFRSHIAAK
jgi:DHA1 family multidrug resistance protein-like MFS transporter